jgi:hypothetical protein
VLFRVTFRKKGKSNVKSIDFQKINALKKLEVQNTENRPKLLSKSYGENKF